MHDLASLRRRSLIALALFSGGWSALLLIAALLFPLAHEGAVSLFSLALSALAAVLAWRARYDTPAALLCAIAPALQPALLVALLAGHPWQMEGHMYFFAGMAALTLTCDWRPIFAATLLIAVHHLGLNFLDSSLLFMGHHGHLDRVLIHAVAVLLTFALLARSMQILQRTFVHRQAADQERAAAENRATEERARALAAEAAAEDRRRSDLADLADSLEGSILAIAASVSAAAVELEASAENLAQFAEETGEEARGVADSARATSEAVAALAARVGDLSTAVETAATTAEEQLRLSDRAFTSSEAGAKSMRTLIERTSGINALVALIKKVAFQTDLLALNAMVEAARAGEAGQGFAVVASEVTNLSGTSRGATDEINTLIGAVGAGALDADRALASAADALRSLSQSAGDVGQTMREQRAVTGQIEQSARTSAAGVEAMVGQFERVAEGAGSAVRLSGEIRSAASRLGDIAHDLEAETRSRLDRLRAA